MHDVPHVLGKICNRQYFRVPFRHASISQTMMDKDHHKWRTESSRRMSRPNLPDPFEPLFSDAKSCAAAVLKQHGARSTDEAVFPKPVESSSDEDRVRRKVMR